MTLKYVFTLYLLLAIQQWNIIYVKSYVFMSQGIWPYEVHVVPACHILCVISADCFPLKCPAVININSWRGQKFVLRVCSLSAFSCNGLLLSVLLPLCLIRSLWDCVVACTFIVSYFRLSVKLKEAAQSKQKYGGYVTK